MSASLQHGNIAVVTMRRQMIFPLFVLYIFANTGCNKICGPRCCLNFYKEVDGSCIECPLGTYGVNCSEKCVLGYYGRLCKSECYCPLERCDVKYGCPKESAGITNNFVEKDKESTSEWINVTCALIGSVTTMSLIGLLFYLKSWFSKTNASSTITNQLNTDRTENQEEHEYESRRSSSSRETENVQPRTHDHPDINNYTDLRFSRMQPLYDNSNDCESGPEAPSINTIPSQRDVNGHDKEVKDDDDDDGEAGREGAYEHFLEHEQYNVLSLRRSPLEKSKTLRFADFLSNLEDNPGEMHDEYDSIEMEEKNKEECAHGIGIMKSELPNKEVCRESLIDETIKDYIESAELSRKLDMVVDNGTNSLKVIPKSKSFTVRESDRPKRFFLRPYSLANSYRRTHLTSEITRMSRISDYEEVITAHADKKNEMDDPKCSHSSNQSNIDRFAFQKSEIVFDENENIKSAMFSDGKEIECQEGFDKIESFEIASSGNKHGESDSVPSDEYSQVKKRPQSRLNSSSTLSAEMLGCDNLSKLPLREDVSFDT